MQGAIVHPLVIQALIRAAGWRGACLVHGLVIVAVGVPVVARFVREPHGHFLRTHSGHPGMAVSSALRSRIFWTLLVVVFGMTLALNGVVVHLPALLVDRGLPASQAVAVMSAMGGASVAGRLLTGWLIDRFDAKHVSFVLLAIAALGAYLLAGASSFSMGAIAAVCIGFGTGGEVDVIPHPAVAIFRDSIVGDAFRRHLDGGWTCEYSGADPDGARLRRHRLLCERSVRVGCRRDRGGGADAHPAAVSAPERGRCPCRLTQTAKRRGYRALGSMPAPDVRAREAARVAAFAGAGGRRGPSPRGAASMAE